MFADITLTLAGQVRARTIAVQGTAAERAKDQGRRRDDGRQSSCVTRRARVSFLLQVCLELFTRKAMRTLFHRFFEHVIFQARVPSRTAHVCSPTVGWPSDLT